MTKGQFIFQLIRLLSLLGFSFVLAFVFTPNLIRFLNKINFTKRNIRKEGTPIFYKYHREKAGIVTGGGIIIWSTVIVISLVLFFLSKTFNGIFSYLNIINRAQTYLPLGFLLIAGIIGLLDDILGIYKLGSKEGGLKMGVKIFLYSLVALIGAFWFYFKLEWDILYIPFLGYINIGWIYILFFYFVIIACAFSSNETDGLDGLLGGVLLFAFSSYIIIAFVLRKFDLAAFLGAILGALLAFLYYNVHPGKIFMGDTGSFALGATLGVVAMLTNTAFFLPFFAFIFVVESSSVIIQVFSKKFRGKKIFYSTPIHHHFQAKGWQEANIVMRFWIISALFSGLGIILFFLSKFL